MSNKLIFKIFFPFLIIFILTSGEVTYSQTCNYSLSTSGTCQPATLSLSPNITGISRIIWKRNGITTGDSSATTLLGHNGVLYHAEN